MDPIVFFIGIAFGLTMLPLWKFCRWLAKPAPKAEITPQGELGPFLDLAVTEGFIKDYKDILDRTDLLVNRMRQERSRYEWKGDSSSMYRANQLGAAIYRITAFDSELTLEYLENLKRK